MAVCRIDATSRQVIVHDNGVDTRHGTVLLRNVEWGAGMCRGEVVETFASAVPARNKQFRRAYFNRNYVSRYIDKETGKVLIKSDGAYLVGSTALYV